MAVQQPKHHIMTPEEIRQKWEFERAGRPWPPVQEHKELLNEVAKLREDNKELKHTRKHTPTELKKTLDLLFESYGIDPAKELVELAISTDGNGNFLCTIDQRIKIWAELLSYRAPKLKAIEMSGHVDHEMTVVVQKFEMGKDGKTMAISAQTPVVNKLKAPIEAEIVQQTFDNQ